MNRKKKSLKTLSKLALAVSAIAFSSVDAFAQARINSTVSVTENFVPGELLVKYKDEISTSRSSELMSRYGLEELNSFDHTKNVTSGVARSKGFGTWRHVRVTSRQDLTSLREMLSADPSVEHVEYNYILQANVVPNDPRFDELWGMNNIGQTGGLDDADINAPEAWDIQTGSEDIVIGVIDSGVDYTHPDLAANMWVNENEIPGNGIDDDDNGYIDDVYGYDFANLDGDPMDDNGHGTHVAGTIAAVGDNNIGVSGVSWNSRIMAIKFLDAFGGGTLDGALEAINYATAMGADLTNNSWGGGGFSQALFEAIEAANTAGSLFVAAAGNSGVNNENFPHYPSDYDADNIISVAAIDHNNDKAGFSNYGTVSVDIAAPGVDILSTSLTSTGDIFDPSGYTAISGTSMAAPHVAGAVALLKAEYPELSHLEIKQRLLSSARYLPSLEGLILTEGALDLASAFENDSVSPATVSDVSVTSTGVFSANLSWSATGDDGTEGQASFYDLRYSTSPITEANFDTLPSQSAIAEQAPGATETFEITGLEHSTTYYVALKASDNVANKSALSNVVSLTTQSVTLAYSNPIDDISDWVIEGTEGPDGPLFHLTNHRFDSPDTALYYGVASTQTYDTPGSDNSGSATTPPIDLSILDSAVLRFSHFLETESFAPFDTATIAISDDDGVTWNVIFSDAMSTDTMVTEQVDISAFAGSVVRLRFSFDTIDSILNNFEGWVVDDIEILGSATIPVANLDGPYSVSIGETIEFDASSSSAGTDPVYSWDFGDGNTEETEGPLASHVYTQAGTYTTTLIISNENGASVPATATVLVNATVEEDFESQGEGELAEPFVSTLGNSLTPTSGLFEVVSDGGNNVLATVENDLVHATYAGDAPLDIGGGFEFSGRMRALDADGQIGVTFFNKYPEEYGYYALVSRGGSDLFHLEAQGSLVYGETQSPVSPSSVAYDWVNFRVQVMYNEEQTEIRAKVWHDSTSEPTVWQIDAYDDNVSPIAEGTFGTWSSGEGVKLWDDFQVTSIGDFPVATIVPDVVGLPQADATTLLLEEAGMDIFHVEHVYNNDGIPAGAVVEQVPAAGELAFEGQSAKLIISLGPVFYFEVPNLVGLTQASAETTITESGFVVGEVVEVYSDTVAAGDIVAQDPASGLYLTGESPVNVVVSLGEESDES